MTTATKKWSDMTKEERAAKIKAGQQAAAERRARDLDAPAPASSIEDIIAKQVAAAVAAVRATESLSGKKDPKDMTKEELKAEHERLQKALEDLPFVGESAGVEPGTVINKGQPTAEYAPYTHAWFENVEARRQDRNIHNGRPQQCDHEGKSHGTTPGLCGLRWPNYDLHTIVHMGTKPESITINGVAYGLLPGVPCKLPLPHYTLYMESLAQLRKHAEQFAPPEHPGTNPGYMHVNISQSSGRPVAVLLGRGPLDDIATREASDRTVTQ